MTAGFNTQRTCDFDYVLRCLSIPRKKRKAYAYLLEGVCRVYTLKVYFYPSYSGPAHGSTYIFR